MTKKKNTAPKAVPVEDAATLGSAVEEDEITCVFSFSQFSR